MDSWWVFIILTLISSTVGTMTGFGTSTIMVPVLSLFLPIPETLLFVGILHWFGDIWKMIFFKKGLNVTLILWFGIPGSIASFLAARLPLTLPAPVLERSLGIFLILYVLFLFLKPRWKIRPSQTSAGVGGLLSGFFAGVFGVGGAIRSMFLSAFDLPKSVFIFTSGLIGLFIDSARITQYALSRIPLTPNLAAILLACIPVSFAGAYLARRFVDAVPQQRFRSVIAFALLLMGARYLLFS